MATFYLVDQFSYAPENSLTAALDYYRTLGNGELHARLAWAYQDESQTSVNQLDNTTLDDRNLVDASIGWSEIRLWDLPGSASVMLWGKNLTDEEYMLLSTASWGFVGSNETATFGEPRTYGISLSWDY